MRRIAGAIVGAALSAVCLGSAVASEGTSLSPEKAWQWLRAGNERFVADEAAPREPYTLQRSRLADGQHPLAIVLTCSDSRVAPEAVFDQNLGDIFVARVAGNVTDPVVLGSIEYAVEHLGAPLLVVLGHSKCGAVKAAVSGGKMDGNLKELIRCVHAESEGASPSSPDAAVAAGVRANVRHHVDEASRKSAVVREAVAAGHLAVVGGVYDLATGTIEWLPAPAAPVAEKEHAAKENAPAPATKKTETTAAEKKPATSAAAKHAASPAKSTITPAKSVIPQIKPAPAKKTAASTTSATTASASKKKPDIVTTKTSTGTEPHIIEASTTHK